MYGQLALFGGNDHNFCNDCITILDDTLNEFTFSDMFKCSQRLRVFEKVP
jgi:hypothetical protein